MDYCEAHIDMVQSIARIETKLDAIPKQICDSLEPMKLHIAQGEKWRMAMIGIIAAGIIQIVTFAYFWGALSVTVQRNTGIVDYIVKMHTTEVKK